MATTNKRKKKFEHLTPAEAAHEAAVGLFKSGIIDQMTMREFDALCLPPVKDLTPTEIKRIRLKEKLSQAVFSKFLNTTPSTVKQWEIGEKHPRGTSLKLLNLVSQKGIVILM